MEIIPVIDLKDGVVVRARMGQRDQYRPIETPLSPGSEPVDVVGGLLSVSAFRTLYVADLDAIERKGDAKTALTRVKSAFPQLDVWVDNGLAAAAAARAFLDDGTDHLVLGSERATGGYTRPAAFATPPIWLRSNAPASPARLLQVRFTTAV